MWKKRCENILKIYRHERMDQWTFHKHSVAFHFQIFDDFLSELIFDLIKWCVCVVLPDPSCANTNIQILNYWNKVWNFNFHSRNWNIMQRENHLHRQEINLPSYQILAHWNHSEIKLWYYLNLIVVGRIKFHILWCLVKLQLSDD